jgi:hypothetical protein
VRAALGRAVVGALVALAAAGVLAWGCATEGRPGDPPHEWRRYEPDGGWPSYRPEPRTSDVDPTRAALGPTVPFMPSTAPVNPAMPGLH